MDGKRTILSYVNSYLPDGFFARQETLLKLAHEAEEADRFEDMCKLMKLYVQQRLYHKPPNGLTDLQLTVEERNLVSVSFKHVVSNLRSSRRSLQSAQQYHGCSVYVAELEHELTSVCLEVLHLLEDDVLPFLYTSFRLQSELLARYYRLHKSSLGAKDRLPTQPQNADASDPIPATLSPEPSEEDTSPKLVSFVKHHNAIPAYPIDDPTLRFDVRAAQVDEQYFILPKSTASDLMSLFQSLVVSPRVFSDDLSLAQPVLNLQSDIPFDPLPVVLPTAEHYEQWVINRGIAAITPGSEIPLNDAMDAIATRYPILRVCQESIVFSLKLCGDYYRYLTEFCPTFQEYRDKTRLYYAQAYALAKSQDVSGEGTMLTCISPVRLGLALNYSVGYYEVLEDHKKACELASESFSAAMHDLEQADDVQYRDTTMILALLRDNLTLWNAAGEQDAEDDPSNNSVQYVTPHDLAEQQISRLNKGMPSDIVMNWSVLPGDDE